MALLLERRVSQRTRTRFAPAPGSDLRLQRVRAYHSEAGPGRCGNKRLLSRRRAGRAQPPCPDRRPDHGLGESRFAFHRVQLRASPDALFASLQSEAVAGEPTLGGAGQRRQPAAWTNVVMW